VNGDVRADGVVDGDVFVVNGNVTVTGRVLGDVTALNGRVTLRSNAVVSGDVVSKDPPRIADGAHVGGEVDRARDRFALGRLGTIGRVFLWVAGTVSSALLGAALLLLVPRGMDAAAHAGRTAIGPAIGLGFAVAFGVPVLGVLLTVTILGLPLGLALLFGLGLLYGTGYAIGALVIGRVMVREPKSRWLAFLAGWGLLRVLAIVPVLGGLVLFATVVYGLGTAVVAIHRGQHRGGAGPDGGIGPDGPVAVESRPATS
jgi:Polymer-forming cytoskeletal